MEKPQGKNASGKIIFKATSCNFCGRGVEVLEFFIIEMKTRLD